MIPIPEALLNDEFRQILRKEIDLSSISHGGTLKKERKISDAITQLLVNTTDHFEKHQDHSEGNVVKFTRELQLRTCGGGKNYSHLRQALNANGFQIDHGYQKPTLQNKGITKAVKIPLNVLEMTTDYLEQINLQRVPLNEGVLVDWTEPFLFDNVAIPSRVRIHTADLDQLFAECQEVSEKLLLRWNLHLRLQQVHQTDGWLEQQYRVSEFGRLVGLGLSSLQTMPKLILKRVLKGCWEVDINACVYALLPSLYNRRLKQEEEFPAIQRYVRLRDVIRESVSEDLGCEVALVKQAFTAVAFGMKSNVKGYLSPEEGKVIPTLVRILQSEARALEFVQHAEVSRVWNEIKKIFAELSKDSAQELNHLNRSQRVAYLTQHEEAKVLKTMIQCVGNKLVIPKHDAMILNQMLTSEELQKIQDQVLKINGHAIDLEQIQVQ